MNISPSTSAGLLDVKNRNRENQHNTGTSIQEMLPISGPGSVRGDSNQATNQEPTSIFDTVVSTAIDTLNPLQHIPGVSTAYEAVTNDTMNPVANMAGGFLFGGPVGLVAGAANSFLELLTGKNIGEHAMAMFSGEPDPSQANDATQTSAQIGDGKPMMQRAEGLSLGNYQAFAETAHEQNLGIGAEANTVAWSTNTWTQQALKQASGIYEAQQNQGAKATVSRFS